MSTSLHSPTDPRNESSPENPVTEQPLVSRSVRHSARPEGFGNRYPIVFDHRDDAPSRELAHWGPGGRILFESLGIPALIIIAAAIITIAWYLIS